MGPQEVLDVIGTLSAGGCGVWIDGGWGVDALLGEVSRQHDDVDLVVVLAELPAAFETLRPLGYVVAEDLAPVRVVLRAPDGRQVDLHPVTFDEEGTGWQKGAAPDGSDCPYPASGFGQGSILGTVVPCLTAELQVTHHSGYAPRDRDRFDLERLARRFSLELPEPY